MTTRTEVFSVRLRRDVAGGKPVVVVESAPATKTAKQYRTKKRVDGRLVHPLDAPTSRADAILRLLFERQKRVSQLVDEIGDAQADVFALKAEA